jgi:hypothetical protein
VGERVANGGKLDELVAGGGEEVLNVLLAAVQKLQAGFVRERALLAARSAGQPQRGDDEPSVRTHIFCAVSAPFDFFSYCASMACCSCLTIFACRCRQHSGRSAGEPEEADLLDGKLLVRLDLDLARLFQRLLLDERDLNSGLVQYDASRALASPSGPHGSGEGQEIPPSCSSQSPPRRRS